MPDEMRSQDNLDRLLKHLKEGSLAARLVHAHRAPDADDPAKAMKVVIRARLEQVRENLDGTEA